MRSFGQLLGGFIMVKSFYEYLYFNLYQWSARVNGESYYNNYSACIMLTALLILNLFTVLTWLDIIFGFSAGDVFGLLSFKVAFFLFIVTLVYLQYRYFAFEYRYKMIISRYAGEVSVKRSSAISISFWVGSLSLLFFTWFVGLSLRG